MGLLRAEGISRFLDRVLIELSPEDFVRFVGSRDKPVVVRCRGRAGVLKGRLLHKYVLFIEGAVVFCRSEEEVELPPNTQVIEVEGDMGYPGI